MSELPDQNNSNNNNNNNNDKNNNNNNNNNNNDNSSVKWSDPGHFLKAQGKFIFSFPCALFLHIFDT